ncbi:MAG: 1,4-alpha-glucan branching protein domain-containing protein [Dictyoglomaceae bacterium]
MNNIFFNLVLHSHIPFVKKAGRWPFGEEWFFEAMLETYIPLTVLFYNLKEKGVDWHITLSVTPVLAEQLSDAYMLYEAEKYIEERIFLAEKDFYEFSKENKKEAQLALFYKNLYKKMLDHFRNSFSRNLLKFWGELQKDGNLEILTSSATHAYLPLLKKNSSIYAQLYIGKETYIKHFGNQPVGIWLPECAYKPGLEKVLSELNFKYFFVDTHSILGGESLGYPEVKRSGKVRLILEPYYVDETEVIVFGRHERTSMQVWSAEWGYPGDGLYREFHKKAETSGLQYWRIVSKNTDLGLKEIYDPEVAKNKALEHANHFVSLLEEEGKREKGIITAMYDTELFGHWWFEGLIFLERVYELINESKIVKSTIPKLYLTYFEPNKKINLPESSWGKGGKHEVWLNKDTEELWQKIHSVEEIMEEASEEKADSLWKEKVLKQMAREKLLLESSDWPFLISTYQARDYGYKRFYQHYENFLKLYGFLKIKEPKVEDFNLLKKMEDTDSLFPNINYNIFRRRNYEK